MQDITNGWYDFMESSYDDSSNDLDDLDDFDVDFIKDNKKKSKKIMIEEKDLTIRSIKTPKE